MKENTQLKLVTQDLFFEYWDDNKSVITQEASEVINYFKPFIETIPTLALGEYYWQIFNNDKPTPRILFVGGDVDNLTPTDAVGLMNVTVDEFFAFFHPDDIRQTLSFILKVFEILFSLTDEERKNVSCSIYARVRTKEGNYLWNCIQYPSLYFEQGNLLFGLVLYTNVNHLMSADAEPMLTVLDSSNKSNQVFTCFSPSHQLGVQKIYPTTSKREREVLALLSQGKASKEIGYLLGISKNTVDNHRQRLLKKFEVKSSAELIMKAFVK